MEERIWDWIYPFHAISRNFGSAGNPPPMAKQGKILGLDLSFSCNFQQHQFSCLKSSRPPPPTHFKTGSIHFMQFLATLVQLAETPPPPQRKKIRDWIYPFHVISRNFGSAVRKAPPPPQIPTRTSTAGRLPPATQDYSPGTVTHLVKFVCQNKRIQTLRGCTPVTPP